MSIEGAVRTRSSDVERPLHQCSELWVNPIFVDRAAGWSWRNSSGCACACDVCQAALHCDASACASTDLQDLVGQCIAYDFGGEHVVWRVERADVAADLLLIRWPD